MVGKQADFIQFCARNASLAVRSGDPHAAVEWLEGLDMLSIVHRRVEVIAEAMGAPIRTLWRDELAASMLSPLWMFNERVRAGEVGRGPESKEARAVAEAMNRWIEEHVPEAREEGADPLADSDGPTLPIFGTIRAGLS